ncbi:asparagine--tRNA ligase, cytoplasmic 2 [Macadamia integrifolia]|uniref:asparagine--tRNA ligase, cytoplasmic 2 n=1 Tax=Macadamia integrifolia TaxID=60698 RepID=UPI001C4EE9EF|nr:asparagine--tRNA ligase, cytoplasmic 2 [Macadamia integrifolia]
MDSEKGAKMVQSHVNLTLSKYSKRVLLKSILGRSDNGLELVGQKVIIGGWVKSSKEQMKDSPPPPPPPPEAAPKEGPKDVSCVEILQSRIPFFRTIIRAFTGHCPTQEKVETWSATSARPSLTSIAYLQVNDGSCVLNLQVVVESSVAPLKELTPTGTSILAEGVLKKSSVQGKHVVELNVENILHTGMVDQDKYPLAMKRIPVDVLRGYSHLRSRTITVASVTRIRNALTYATHTFFQNNDFLHVHVPIITTTDAKGFSEKFQVTCLSGKADKESKETNDIVAVNLEVVRGAIKEKGNKVDELKRSDSNREALFAALQDLKKANELALQLEAQEKSKPRTLSRVVEVDFSKDFFGRQAYLTVSGQLHLESYACALGNVYTFGPTFQAEKTQNIQHLAESWVVELEMAFSDLEDVMNCAVDFLKFLCQWILEHCSDDMGFVCKRIDVTSSERLQSLVSSSFERITYTEAVELLKDVTDKKFEAKIEWGVPLTEEHESYLAEVVYKRPIIIYNHPKEIKPFHMRLNDDERTVAAIDVVLPKTGTLIRGGQREERFEMLSTRMKELNLPMEQYEWYLDLRRHGTIKHSGLSLEFDSVVLWACGLYDIRDVVPFPRSCGNLNF